MPYLILFLAPCIGLINSRSSSGCVLKSWLNVRWRTCRASPNRMLKASSV